jgi:HD superfamily phosphohydrolase
MIDEDGVHAVEQFVLAKYYMTANVYRHRVRLITDQMLTRAIRLGIDVDKLEHMTRLYAFDGSADFIRHYQGWDDARFVETFCPVNGPHPGAKSGAMLKRLRERKLLKEVFKDRIGAPYHPRSWETLRGLHRRDADALSKAVAQQVAAYLSKELQLNGTNEIDPDFVIAHSYSIKSARESSRNDEEGILVDLKPTPQPFTDVSTLFKSINEQYSDNFAVVFAPIEWPDPDKKDDLRATWKEPIRGMIQEEWKRLKP